MLHAIRGVAPIYGTLYILVDPVTRPMVKNPWARWTMSMGGGGKGGRRERGEIIFERVNLFVEPINISGS